MTSYVVSASLGLSRQIPFVGSAISGSSFLAHLRRVHAALLRRAESRREAASRPHRRRRRRLAFEIMKRQFCALYSEIPTYTLVYGAFAVIRLFLLWIYYPGFDRTRRADHGARAGFAVLREVARRPSGSDFAEALACSSFLRARSKARSCWDGADRRARIAHRRSN